MQKTTGPHEMTTRDSVNHPYDEVVSHLSDAFAALDACGLGDVLAKGGVGTVLLAHRLGHELVEGDKGADARNPTTGLMYEYKVSITDQFNFHFGGRPKPDAVDGFEHKVRRHFSNIEGAYCGLRKGANFTRIAWCPSVSLVEDLLVYFEKSKSTQLVKNYRIDNFLGLEGATEII